MMYAGRKGWRNETEGLDKLYPFHSSAARPPPLCARRFGLSNILGLLARGPGTIMVAALVADTV